MFVGTKEPSQAIINEVEQAYVRVNDSFTFGAQVRAWGASFGTDFSNALNHAIIQTNERRYAMIAPDTSALRKAPPGALFFLRRIDFGNSCTIVFARNNNSRGFNAGVSFGPFGGSVESYAQNKNISYHYKCRGLDEATSQRLMVQESVDGIRRAVSGAKSQPVPIMVEYQTIPNVCIDAAVPIKWPGQYAVDVRLKSLHVHQPGKGSKDDWFLRASCKINGEDFVGSYRYPLTPGGGAVVQVHRGRTYQLADTIRLFLTEGDRLDCGTFGTVVNHNWMIPYAGFSYTAGPGPTHIPGSVEASDRAHYRLDYEINVTPPSTGGENCPGC